MKIRKLTEQDFRKVMEIAKSLHKTWFDNHAINKEIPVDIKISKGFVAEEKNRIIGFITYNSYEGSVELGWIGVRPNCHRKGIGTALIQRLDKELLKIGVNYYKVRTLSEKTKYKPYEQTRFFYLKNGFELKSAKKHKSKDTGEQFYMATYIKKLK